MREKEKARIRGKNVIKYQRNADIISEARARLKLYIASALN